MSELQTHNSDNESTIVTSRKTPRETAVESELFYSSYKHAFNTHREAQTLADQEVQPLVRQIGSFPESTETLDAYEKLQERAPGSDELQDRLAKIALVAQVSKGHIDENIRTAREAFGPKSKEAKQLHEAAVLEAGLDGVTIDLEQPR